MLSKAGELNVDALEISRSALVRKGVSQVNVNNGAELTMSRGVSSSSPQQRKALIFFQSIGILICCR